MGALIGSRRTTSLLVAGLVALGSLVATARPAAAVTAPGARAADEVRAVELINAERRSRGLSGLTVHLQLTRLAREHAARMAADAEAGGRCGDGRTLRHRSPIDAGVTAAWTKLRENVGCAAGSYATIDALHDGFMSSSGHRANILATDVTYVGVGVAVDTGGTMWVTEIFMAGGQPPVLAAIEEGLLASRTLFPDGTRPRFVVLARGDDFADSLGGAALAGSEAPVLFTDGPTAEEPDPVLRPRTRVEIDRLLGGRGLVYLLGGPKAVSARVEQELTQAGYEVRRLWGETRIETAVAVAEEIVRRRGTPAAIAVSYAWNWPDAVTGGAAAAHRGAVVVLTDRDRIPAATRDFLAAHPGVERVVFGGGAVVSDAVVAELGARRLWGETRVETALAIADHFFDPVGDRIVVVDGWDAFGWGRALAWAPYAARHTAPQVLVGPSVPDTVRAWLASLDGGAQPIFASNVTTQARSEVEQALGG